MSGSGTKKWPFSQVNAAKQAVRLPISPAGNAGARASNLGFLSAAFSENETKVAIASPRGGRAQVFISDTGELLIETVLADACGIAGHERGFVLTGGNGKLCIYSDRHPERAMRHERAWDNHLVELVRGGSGGWV